MADDEDGQEEAARRVIARNQAYRNVFEHSPDGRLVLLDLIEKGGLLAIVPIDNELELAFQAGRRDLVLKILEEIRFNPERLMALALGRLDDRPSQE